MVTEARRPRLRIVRLAAVVRRKGLRGAARALLADLNRRAGGATREEVKALRARLGELDAGLRRAQGEAGRQAASLRVLAMCQAGGAPGARGPDDGPLVSVVLPVRDQAASLGAAIESVQAQRYPSWELLVVDDGSADRTPEVLEEYAGDTRVRIFRQEPRGVSAARNRALEAATGSIVAYLDADNLWYPHFLGVVVSTLTANPDRSSVYLAEVVASPDGRDLLRFEPFDRLRLQEHNLTDLNVFAHRRDLYLKCGGFDESLTSAVDWDLIGRYCEDETPVAVPVLGGVYRDHDGDRISTREPVWYDRTRVQRRLERPIPERVRVLYLLFQYPQLTESYVRWEIDYMRRRGVEIEVWTELSETPAPFETDVPIHRGRVEDAIARFRPHLAHVHWLNVVPRVRDAVMRAGLPITARGHSFDFAPKVVARLQDDPVIQRLYLYPHFLPELASKAKVTPLCTPFPGHHYAPAPGKDTRLVLRCGAAIPGKDIETFLAVAERCPDHRFVLVLGRATGHEAYADELVARNRERGEPVEIHVNLQAEEVAPLVARAGIFMHTFGSGSSFGQPTGICEAMATGAYVIARRNVGAAALLGDVGALYATADQAVTRIRETLGWSNERWREVQRAASERAFQRHADTRVLPRVLEDWRAIARTRVLHDDSTPLLDERFQPLIDYMVRRGYDELAHHDGAFTAHQIGIARGLLAWGADLEVCQAGIAHSFYGTERATGAAYYLEEREALRDVIGTRAERLAYANCAMTAASLEAALAAAAGPRRLRDRFSGGEIALDEADFHGLCQIHLCDWLEQVPRCGRWSQRRALYRRLAEHLGGRPLADWQRVYSLER
jgi:glycosyltransferase involved in cell wall biosynthesis